MEYNKSKTLFWVLLDLLIVGILVNLVFFVMPAVRRYGNSLAPVRTITVSAEGKTTVTPDISESSFSVVSRGRNPEELADGNNQKISAVIQFLKSEIIADKDIKTVGYNLSPDYRYDPKIERNFITGYTLTQTVLVKIRDLNKVAKIIGGLTPLGVNQIGGINFSVEDQEKFLAIAREDAFLKAKTKAAEMASRGGVRLGRIIGMSESQSGYPIPYYSLGGRSAEAAPVAAPTIEPGSQEIKDQITLTYELE